VAAFTIDYLTYYIIICLIAAATPGPGTLAVLNNALSHGLRKNLPLMLGIIVGMGVVGITTVSGLTALIVHSDLAFSAIKYVGGFYIGYLGIMGLLPLFKPAQSNSETQNNKKYMTFYTGIILSVFNPKTLVFFTALLPSFIMKTGDPTQQTLLLTIILLICTFGVHLAYSKVCSLVSVFFQHYMKWIDAITGGTFIVFAFLIIFKL